MKTPAQIEQEIIDYYYENFSPRKYVVNTDRILIHPAKVKLTHPL
jgi:hypothetical protein